MSLTMRRTWPEEPFPKRDWLIVDDGEKKKPRHGRG